MLTTRKDILDLIGPQFDKTTDHSDRRRLIICSAPRTGSYELCRLLTAAGIGVPHEYFHPNYATRLAQRWQINGDPLSNGLIQDYLALLSDRRAQSGVFATKLQYWQFQRFLKNSVGEALFEKATVVHLYHPDIAHQFASWRVARATGRWDFSERQTTEPLGSAGELEDEKLRHDVEFLLEQDTGFRRLFVLLDIHPIFATIDDIGRSPRAVIERIAAMLDVKINDPALDEMIRHSAPYPHDAKTWEKVNKGVVAALKPLAFR